jgi:hypothetical protein
MGRGGCRGGAESESESGSGSESGSDSKVEAVAFASDCDPGCRSSSPASRGSVADVKTRSLLGRSFLVTLLMGTAPQACGQSAATCESVCALPGAPVSVSSQIMNPGGDGNVETTTVSCVAACKTNQTTCSSGGFVAEFQAYLTCVENAGAYADTQENVDTTNPTMPAH